MKLTTNTESMKYITEKGEIIKHGDLVREIDEEDFFLTDGKPFIFDENRVYDNEFYLINSDKPKTSDTLEIKFHLELVKDI